MGTKKERIHILVSGQVQNVGFRAYVMDQGVRLDLTGWVRNIGYDIVETTAEGDRPALEQFAAAVRTGPRGARVVNADVEWLPASGEFSRFEVRHSR